VLANTKIKILHVCTDEKFIDGTIDLFESVFPGGNKFLIFGSRNQPLKYVRSKKVIIGDSKYIYFGGMKRDVSRVDVIIIHFLTEMAAYLALQAPKKTKIIWSGWGADYYRLMPEFSYKAILPDTRRLILDQKKESQGKSRCSIKSKIVLGVNRFFMKNSLVDVIRRVDYFSSPVPMEYDIVKKNIPGFYAKYIQLNYSSLSSNLNNNVTRQDAKNILVGNSATPTNNHLEIFILLKKVVKKDVKIIVPLSYGDLEYREKVLKIGNEMFGDNFQPLVGFLVLSDYLKILEGCQYVVMNHIRQQGRGNILMALYAGKKVFLRKESIIYEHLISIGIELKTIDEMDADSLCNATAPLVVNKNRAVIKHYWSDEVVMGNVRRIQDLLDDKKGRGYEKI